MYGSTYDKFDYSNMIHSVSVLVSILSCYMIECQANLTNAAVPLVHDDQCPPWFFYNTTTKECKCYGRPTFGRPGEESVRCIEQRASLGYNFCMTYKEEDGVSVSYCAYFELTRGHKISEPGFIELPDNISELNDYMCGPLNRKGIVCSECIDGFGPSATSPKYKCSNCTNVWYGVPLYLLVELVPVSAFYLIILLFQINLTSAPMISFILHCNLVVTVINFILAGQELKHYLSIISVFYGMWTLDFFRNAIPPFCISPKLDIIHILYLKSISTVTPFVLIGITWLCIELHSRNFKLVVWLWKSLGRLFPKYIKRKRSSKRTIIDTFATFFLLSYAKLTLMLLIPLSPLDIDTRNNLSSTATRHVLLYPSVNYFGIQHLPFVIISMLVFTAIVLPPVLLLALYPVRAFRSLLFKCCCSVASLNIFVEKFYGCYRDGLDGGRDMRSFASLYFFVILLCYMLWTSSVSLFLIAVVLGGCGLLILIVQPYKKRYMSILDALILANLAIVSTALDHDIYSFPFYLAITIIFTTFPLLGLVGYVVYILFNDPLRKALQTMKGRLQSHKSFNLLHCCNRKMDNREEDVQQENLDGNGNLELPHRVVHPELYVELKNSKSNVSV